MVESRSVGALPDEIIAALERKGSGEIASRKRVLTIEEIEHLESLLRDTFNYVTELKKKESLATHTQYPKLPSILSESAVVHMSKRLFPESRNARLGGKEADIIIEVPERKRHIEVKATGEHGFEAFYEKDVKADWIVWIHFGTVFRRGSGGIVLYKFEDPRKIFVAGKVILEKALKLVPEKHMTKLTGSSLSEIVRKNS